MLPWSIYSTHRVCRVLGVTVLTVKWVSGGIKSPFSTPCCEFSSVSDYHLCSDVQMYDTVHFACLFYYLSHPWVSNGRDGHTSGWTVPRFENSNRLARNLSIINILIYSVGIVAITRLIFAVVRFNFAFFSLLMNRPEVGLVLNFLRRNHERMLLRVISVLSRCPGLRLVASQPHRLRIL